MSKPTAVLISDIHYNLQTLEVADAALRMAVDKANELDVDLVVAGDIHDTKANMRAECVNAIMNTVSKLNPSLNAYFLCGNHDLWNEKGKETSIEFLRNYGAVVQGMMDPENLPYMIGYQSNPEAFRLLLNMVPKGSTVVMHQGVQGALAGDYIVDKSAIPKEWLDGYRVISGHYHTRQTFKCGKTGVCSYLGNPFTLGFGEANDPEKGFHVLCDDGSLEFVPANLRKHIVWETHVNETEIASFRPAIRSIDLLKVKITGTSEQLANLDKGEVAKKLVIENDFKLEFNYIEQKTDIDVESTSSQVELLDNLIDTMHNTTDEQKSRLKELWRKSTTN